MTSTRGNWLRCVLGGLTVLVVGAPTVRAQGFGPDPFKPFNWMYVPYTTAIGPTTLGAGQAAASMGRSSLGGANQFENYMMELHGAGRASREKYGIGLPYYRASVDPLFDRDGRREYQPNRRTEPTFEDTMDRVTQKYLAYFSEKDPRKRAILMRDYKLTQRNSSRQLSLLNRRGGLREDLRVGAESDSGPRGRASALEDDDLESPRETSRSRARSADGAPGTSRGERTGGASSNRTIPPAPEIGTSTRARSARPGRTPAETLDRARRFDERVPSTRRSATDGRSSDSRAIPAAPPLDD